MFNVNFKDIALKWIEPDIRVGKILDLIYSFLKPAKSINNNLQDFVESIDYKLRYNGQVIYLERYLNDIYDPILRRIFISDADRKPINYLYNKLESKPITYLYNKLESKPVTYIYNHSENDGSISFWVNIPSSIVYNKIVITQQINIYKMAGKGFGFKSLLSQQINIIQ